MQDSSTHDVNPVPWNKGIIMGQKPPLKRSEVWAIRIRLQIAEQVRDLAMFNMAIDSKLRACDLVRLRVRDVAHGPQISSRAIVMQRKTRHPVQFEITAQTRAAVDKLIVENRLEAQDYLFSSLLPTVQANPRLAISLPTPSWSLLQHPALAKRSWPS